MFLRDAPVSVTPTHFSLSGVTRVFMSRTSQKDDTVTASMGLTPCMDRYSEHGRAACGQRRLSGAMHADSGAKNGEVYCDSYKILASDNLNA